MRELSAPQIIYISNGYIVFVVINP